MSPGFDQPQIVLASPRCKTMLSPNIGLTKGNDVLSAALAAASKTKPKTQTRTDLIFMI